MVQVSSDDPLARMMKPSQIPRLVWIKDLTQNLIEEYTGEYEKLPMMLWLQKNASYRMKKPEKKLTEFTKEIAKSSCGTDDSNFCLFGFYSNQAEKQNVTQKLQELLKKYQEDPVLVFVVDRAKLKPSCVLHSSNVTDSFVIFRTKRKKYSSYNDNISTTQLSGQLDNALGGEMLKQKMSYNLSQCVN